MQNRSAAAGLLVALLLISSASCQADPALWATISASNTEIAWTGTPNATASPSSTPTMSGQTATPTPEPSPLPSPTSSIIEVTPLGGQPEPWIIVLGNINEPPQPGVWVWVAGRYYSYEDWNVRGCEDLSCAVTGALAAGQTIDTVGGTVDGAGALWLCRAGIEGRDYGEDPHGAQWCNRAFLAWDPVHLWNGFYEVTK